VLLHRLRPRHRCGAGNMAGALRALLLVAGHGDELARELLRRADVDELGLGVERRLHLVALGADGLVAGLGGEARGGEARHVGGGGAVLADPLLARRVEQLDVVVPVVLQVPVGVGGEPVVAVAVEHDQVVVGDAVRAEELAEGLRAEEVALDLVLQVLLPVKADRAGDVRLGVQGGVLVDLDDPDGIVVEVVFQPLRVDENVLRVVRHGYFLLIPTNKRGFRRRVYRSNCTTRARGSPSMTAVGISHVRAASCSTASPCARSAASAGGSYANPRTIVSTLFSSIIRSRGPCSGAWATRPSSQHTTVTLSCA